MSIGADKACPGMVGCAPVEQMFDSVYCTSDVPYCSGDTPLWTPCPNLAVEMVTIPGTLHEAPFCKECAELVKQI